MYEIRYKVIILILDQEFCWIFCNNEKINETQPNCGFDYFELNVPFVNCGSVWNCIYQSNKNNSYKLYVIYIKRLYLYLFFIDRQLSNNQSIAIYTKGINWIKFILYTLCSIRVLIFISLSLYKWQNYKKRSGLYQVAPF